MIRPQTATEILRTASETLGERGKQYDPNGKQERSMTAIVAAFNAIYPRNLLTVHMGWQFMSLVKMVRGATKPHIDSALDQVAYASLAAEEVANQFVAPESAPTAHPTEHYVVLGDLALLEAQSNYIMNRVRDGATVKIMSDATARRLHLEEELEEEPKPTAAKRVEQLLEHNRSLEVQLDTCRASLINYQCRFDLDKEYMTKERVLAGQAKHEKQVAKLRERELLDIETINDLREELASCKALIDRLYKEKQEAERELEQVRRTNCNRSADLTTLEQVHQAALEELETVRGECLAQTSRISELQTLVDNLRSSLAQATKEAPCAHNTDEPKAPRPEYVDPFDQYGDIRSPMHRLVGGHDPARGGLAYPAGKDAPTPL